MVYSKYFYPQQTRVPVVLSVVLILVIIIFLAKLLGTPPVPSKASKVSVSNVNVVNVSNNAAGIYWQTENKEVGWVILGENQALLSNIVLDSRDVPEEKNPFRNHYVDLKNLKPNTNYYYKIVSNNQLVSQSNGQPFSFKTASNSSLASNLGPAYGKIIKENGQPLENAAVLLYFDNSIPLLSISKSTGEWLVPVNNILDKNSLQNKTVDEKTKLKVEIYDEEMNKTIIQADLSSLIPLPQTIIIGKDYSFSSGENVLSASSSNVAVDSHIVDILFPKDQAVIPGDNPLIKGLGIPKNQVNVLIDAPKGYRGQAVIDNDGVWEILLNNPLSPGNHVLTMTTKDDSGKTVTLTRRFTIAKSGEQVMGIATAEATPTSTIIPTSVISPTTYYISLTPTVSPPISGSDITPIAITSSSLIILGLGMILVF